MEKPGRSQKEQKYIVGTDKVQPCGNKHNPEWWCPQCKKDLLLSGKLAFN